MTENNVLFNGSFHQNLLINLPTPIFVLLHFLLDQLKYDMALRYGCKKTGDDNACNAPGAIQSRVKQRGSEHLCMNIRHKEPWRASLPTLDSVSDKATNPDITWPSKMNLEPDAAWQNDLVDCISPAIAQTPLPLPIYSP